MSSMKNVYKSQKVHRERHQKAARASLGPLEKKKDYKVRARHQEKKKALLKKLHKKALERNPNEFHFHMHNSVVQDGKHKEIVNVEETSVQDVQKDLTYIRFRRTMEQKRIEMLRANLHFLEPVDEDDTLANTHLLFVDTPEQAATANPSELLNTVPELLSRPFNRLRKEQLKGLPKLLSVEKDAVKQVSSAKAKSYKELCRRIERDQKLQLLEAKLEAKVSLKKYEAQNEKRRVPLPEPKLLREGSETEAPVYQWPSIRKR